MTGKASRRGKANQKARYDALKAAGLCVVCKKATNGENIRCNECRAKRVRQNQIYRIKKKLNMKTNNRQPPNGFADFH